MLESNRPGGDLPRCVITSTASSAGFARTTAEMKKAGVVVITSRLFV
jgi:hypothetical protein